MATAWKNSCFILSGQKKSLKVKINTSFNFMQYSYQIVLVLFCFLCLIPYQPFRMPKLSLLKDSNGTIYPIAGNGIRDFRPLPKILV